MNIKTFTALLTILDFISTSYSTFVLPSTFLEAKLAKGSWVSKKDLADAAHTFEGGWVWSESGNMIMTHVCRAKSGDSSDKVSIEPGELLNGTCFIPGLPTSEHPNGIQKAKDYEVLVKGPEEIYEWVGFDSQNGHVPDGGVIGGIGPNYQPILVCRRLFNGTAAGVLRKSKAVLGKFIPKEGKCFYELELGGGWIHWDRSFATETFQLLVLKPKEPEPCKEPREGQEEMLAVESQVRR